MSFCGNAGCSVRRKGASGVSTERGRSVAPCEAWCRCPDLSRSVRETTWTSPKKMKMIWTTLLLVVGFAGTVQPGWLDYSTCPVGGPSGLLVGTDRVLRHRRFCLLSVEAFLPVSNVPFDWNAPAVLARLGCFGRAGLGFGASVVCCSSGRAELSRRGFELDDRWPMGAQPVRSFVWNESMSRPFADRQADGAALRLFDGAGPGRVVVAPPQYPNTRPGPGTGESFREFRRRLAGGRGLPP